MVVEIAGGPLADPMLYRNRIAQTSHRTLSFRMADVPAKLAAAKQAAQDARLRPTDPGAARGVVAWTFRTPEAETDHPLGDVVRNR